MFARQTLANGSHNVVFFLPYKPHRADQWNFRTTAWSLSLKVILERSIAFPLWKVVSSSPVEVSESPDLFHGVCWMNDFEGDNGTTQIWALCINMCSQVLQDYCSRWGQITCIKWLGCDTDAVKNLCFGTGRGLILIYQQTRAGVSIMIVIMNDCTCSSSTRVYLWSYLPLSFSRTIALKLSHTIL